MCWSGYPANRPIARANQSARFLTVKVTVKHIPVASRTSIHASFKPSETIEWE